MTTTTYGTDGALSGRSDKLAAVRIAGEKNRLSEVRTRALWFDARREVSLDRDAALIERLVNGGEYNGVVANVADAAAWLVRLPPRIQLIIELATGDALAGVESLRSQTTSTEIIIASDDRSVLAAARAVGHSTCLRAYVDDRDSLHASIHGATEHDHLMVRFRDPTNIPLELVIATLQATSTVLVKEIADHDIDDAIVTLGVMEVGADGVLFSPRNDAEYDSFIGRRRQGAVASVTIESATVIRSEPVGMGYRSCIDLAAIFSETEGMLVGSTSQGGVLCCPEVFFLPYMELRPFRVNAGGVHSYVYNVENRTDYMTELRGGSPVMIVDATGRTRRAAVGRVKTEVRPLRLIEVEFAGGERVNVILQDDWHVRIFSADAKPLNITELATGDRVLAHRAQPGRHVGIAVDEHIIER